MFTNVLYFRCNHEHTYYSVIYYLLLHILQAAVKGCNAWQMSMSTYLQIPVGPLMVSGLSEYVGI